LSVLHFPSRLECFGDLFILLRETQNLYNYLCIPTVFDARNLAPGRERHNFGDEVDEEGAIPGAVTLGDVCAQPCGQLLCVGVYLKEDEAFRAGVL
jgi:hypothetical protein